MRRDPSTHLADGADFMLWAITDWLVDDYFPVFDKLGDEIDDLEDDVIRKPVPTSGSSSGSSRSGATCSRSATRSTRSARSSTS